MYDTFYAWRKLWPGLIYYLAHVDGNKKYNTIKLGYRTKH